MMQGDTTNELKLHEIPQLSVASMSPRCHLASQQSTLAREQCATTETGQGNGRNEPGRTSTEPWLIMISSILVIAAIDWATFVHSLVTGCKLNCSLVP